MNLFLKGFNVGRFPIEQFQGRNSIGRNSIGNLTTNDDFVPVARFSYFQNIGNISYTEGSVDNSQIGLNIPSKDSIRRENVKSGLNKFILIGVAIGVLLYYLKK
jgi:hypothetical protein